MTSWSAWSAARAPRGCRPCPCPSDREASLISPFRLAAARPLLTQRADKPHQLVAHDGQRCQAKSDSQSSEQQAAGEAGEQATAHDVPGSDRDAERPPGVLLHAI